MALHIERRRGHDGAWSSGAIYDGLRQTEAFSDVLLPDAAQQ
ncbi:hypothetical protein [Streptomyces sp. NPDC058295]